ncbi:MAG: hypothetical protein RL071_4617 [Pseudomonadota bacterium]
MSPSLPRFQAVKAASERAVRTYPRPLDREGRPVSVGELFGANVFGIEQMRQHLPGDVFRRFERTIAEGTRLDSDLAASIAAVVHDWCQARGVTHFCHWFQPMTGSTAEKHDAFLTFDDERPISKLSGGQLIQSEPDASSFPSGGMRSTFEARGYTAWDSTSPMFIMERESGATLCIPSVFVSYTGPALDKKAPLLRSMRAIGEQAAALCRELGDDSVKRVIVTAGPEQEYFLVDRALVSLRPDLVIAGRSVLGASAPKGQMLEDHYFGAIPSRVQAFMHELEHELYKVGVPAKTRHNEVAPCQFEIAVLYREANVAADHNQLVMELLRRVAERHGFACLLHEKPFAGVNGSGKHINWSMQTDAGDNLLEPTKNPAKNPRFLAFLASTVLGVYRNADLLRASIASHGNDFRLGANEAPPAIISVFLGAQLTALCAAILAGQDTEDAERGVIELGVGGLPDLAKDSTDRNRTSPFAFTGNKFEFRACGSQMSVSWPTTCVNVAVADGIRTFRAMLAAKGGDLLAALREALAISAPIRFEGNNYSDAWVEEAARRGLPNLRKAPEALDVLRTSRVESLMADLGVLTPDELHSRYHIAVERYVHGVDIEVDLIREMVDQAVMPAALGQLDELSRTMAGVKAAGLSEDPWAELGDLSFVQQVKDLRSARAAVDAAWHAVEALPEAADRARACVEAVLPAVDRLRAASDALEPKIADSRWPLPRYRELLFQSW